MSNRLPKLTPRQIQILHIIYSYRFVTRIQIQAFLNHKDHKHINAWLKYLRDNDYVGWIYSNDLAGRTKPAIYYLATNGIRYLRGITMDNEPRSTVGAHAAEELQKRYRDAERSRSYVDRCVTVANCALDASNPPADARYTWETEADYRDGGPNHFLANSKYARPQLVLHKQLRTPSGKRRPNSAYLVEVCEQSLPRTQVLLRARKYVQFFMMKEWIEESGTADERLGVLFICQTHSDMLAAKRSARRELDERWDYGDKDRPYILFTDINELRAKGMHAEIWDQA